MCLLNSVALLLFRNENKPTTVPFKKSIISARISGSGGFSGPETLKTYTANVYYILKSYLNDLGDSMAQWLGRFPDIPGSRPALASR